MRLLGIRFSAATVFPVQAARVSAGHGAPVLHLQTLEAAAAATDELCSVTCI